MILFFSVVRIWGPRPVQGQERSTLGDTFLEASRKSTKKATCIIQAMVESSLCHGHCSVENHHIVVV